jgi:hypothetical protein
VTSAIARAQCLRLCCLAVASIAAAQQPFVRISGSSTRAIGAPPPSFSSSGPQMLVTGSICSSSTPAFQNQAVPGGGTLEPIAYINPATVGALGHIAFIAHVANSQRNQGVFIADNLGLHPLALGSGGGGGSGNPGPAVGDPSPIGGRFTGFFDGTIFAPAINTAGDALFMADVNGGSSPRGLFLYREATHTIVKIAAVGDASPAGGTLGAIGPGSINASGVVVFLATGSSSNDHQLLRWSSGVLTKIARVGDPAPGGGTYQFLGGEAFGFVDGTSIPIGPLPDINDAGVICFRGISSLYRGIVVDNGAQQWYVRAGDPTPVGGTYFDMQGANINNAGQVAFYADTQPTPTTYSGGWFVGQPGSWHKAVGFYDAIDGGQCTGLAFSRNPMSPLSDDGDLVAWINITYPVGPDKEWLVLGRADGTVETIIGHGATTPIGGFVGSIDAWPSMNSGGQATLNCGTPGASSTDAHFLLTLCPLVDTYCTAGTSQHGCVASIGAVGIPSASASSGFTISVNNVEGQRSGILFYGLDSAIAAPWGTGGTSFLCVKAPTQRTGTHNSGGTLGACNGSFALDFNAFRAAHPTALGSPFTAGEQIEAQGWYRDPGSPKNTSLSDALEFSLAP